MITHIKVIAMRPFYSCKSYARNPSGFKILRLKVLLIIYCAILDFLCWLHLIIMLFYNLSQSISFYDSFQTYDKINKL